MSPKHIPLRTCVHCQQVRPKRDLVRIVRSPEGVISVDERGKSAGRGAYVCRCRACLQGSIARRRLDHALKAPLTPEDRQRLNDYSEGLPDALSSENSEQL